MGFLWGVCSLERENNTPLNRKRYAFTVVFPLCRGKVRGLALELLFLSIHILITAVQLLHTSCGQLERGS